MILTCKATPEETVTRGEFELADKPTQEELGTGGGKAKVEQGRYAIPDPDTMKPARWTRATTFAKTIAETENLQRWGERMAIMGVVQRPDLMARVERATAADKQMLDAVVREGKTQAGAWKKAGYGTTFHTMTERVDRGELDPFRVGAPWGAMLRAYVQILQDYRIKILPEFIEQTVVIQKYKVAGTLDRVVEMPTGELWIADVKTGRDLSWSWGEIAIQLSLYAHADKIWDAEAEKFLDMPEVSRTQALVIHAPVEGDAVSLHRINIELGWRAAELCHAVRNYRRFRKMAEPVGQVPIGDDAPDLPRKWAQQIAAAMSAHDLSVIWHAATAAGEWTEALEALGRARHKELES